MPENTKKCNHCIKYARKIFEILAIRAEIIGPTPRFNEKAAGSFNWQVIVKSKQRTDLVKILATLPSGWSYDIDPTNLL